MKLGGVGPRKNTHTVTLRRDGPYTPWGIRLVGGADLGAPLVITRAQVGSPSEGELKRGDVVRKIGDYDARDLRHEDAQNLFRSAGNSISLVVERQGANSPALAAVGASATLPRARTQPLPQVRPTTPLTPLAGPLSPANKPPVAGGVATPFAIASQAQGLNRPSTPGGGRPGAGSPYVLPSPLAMAPQPPRNLPISFPPPLPDRPLEEDINAQPYRTTPLVLPGAKVKKDAAQTESYLRHHPNPMFRAPPSHYDPSVEVLMKQKVADTVLQRVVGEEAAGTKVVHKQFNSPIGLYSDQNIAETIQSQTGATPLKKTYVYDPSKSETFKALKESEFGEEVQEMSQPVQPKVFTPQVNKNVHFKKPVSAPHQTYVNSLGNTADNIQQSGSFRRLMNAVLGESEY
ncbi:hypothetical protein R5R35_005993 [Gryllus longicercus]|uniref:PDZ domain-containing protein n=1 Tax=Gryllus longicercus TaxID=2509291 RepID=A0AAN9YZY4_9ORTH